MDPQILDIYNTLVKFRDENKEEEAKAFLKERFMQLSEEQQGSLLSRLYVNALERAMEDENIMASVQEQGIAALQELNEEEKRIKGGN